MTPKMPLAAKVGAIASWRTGAGTMRGVNPVPTPRVPEEGAVSRIVGTHFDTPIMIPKARSGTFMPRFPVLKSEAVSRGEEAGVIGIRCFEPSPTPEWASL